MRKSTLSAITSVLLTGVVVGGACAAGYASRDEDGKWFSNSDIKTWHWSDKDNVEHSETWGGAIDNVGNEMNADTTYAMPAAMSFYSLTSESVAQILTAPSVTVTASHNFEFNNVKVDWAVEYPSGASAADVVTVTPISDGSLTAIVTCECAFDQQLILKATLRGDESKSAICTIDYVKRLVDEVSITGISGNDFSDLCGVSFVPIYGEGTVKGNISVKSFNVYLYDNFVENVKKYLTFDISFKNAYLHDIPFYSESSNNGLLSYEESYEWDYSMFINRFDDFDDAHKKAIYYAWYTAWKDNFGYKNPNLYYDLVLDLSYNGTVLQTVYLHDLVGVPLVSYLNGDCYGSELSPDLTLNTNIAL